MLKTMTALGFAVALTTIATAPARANIDGISSTAPTASDTASLINREQIASLQCGCYRPYVRYYRVRYVYRPVYRVRVCGCRYYVYR